MPRPPHPPPQTDPRYALAWSYSRHAMLAGCARQVFWHYFGSRGAGLEDQPDGGRRDATRAWALRHLTALPLLVGTVVHNAAREVLAAALAGAEPPSVDTLLAGARFTLNHVWRSSQPEHVDQFWRYPGAFTALREVVLRDGGLRPFEIDAAKAKLAACLGHLVDAPVLVDLERAARDGASDVIVPGGGPESVVLGDGVAAGTVVWAAIDFAYRTPLGGDDGSGAPAQRRVWCLADWKTGQPDAKAEALQLAGYALWAEARGLEMTDGAYLGRIVDLARAEDRWYRLDAEALLAARRVVAEDLARQRALMREPAHAAPLPVAEWPRTTDRRRCRTCVFSPLCFGEGAAP